MPRLSVHEVERLADMYQRIADRRRIDWVNQRDAKQDWHLTLATIIAVAVFFGMWFV